MRWFHGDKDEKNVIEKKKEIEKHGACIMCSEKMAVEDGCKVFFSHFLGIKILENFDPQREKLDEFTLENF